MSRRWKLIIFIILSASLYWALIQKYGAEECAKPLVSVAELRQYYLGFNDEYYGGKLPKDVVIDYSETSNRYMATTTFWQSDHRFHIAFNPKHTTAERVVLTTLLHESCHIETWGEVDDGGMNIVMHGRRWRTCMLRLDAAGAFRELLIDQYMEAQ